MPSRVFQVLGFLLLLFLCLPAGRREPVPPSLPRTKLVFGGDVMLSRYVGRVARYKKDPAGPFRDVAQTFSEADIAFVNLESPFSDRGPVMDKGMIFKAEPDMMHGLELAGIDIVSTANNHARDCGDHGVEFTLAWLASHGIANAGTGATREAAHGGAVLERNGVRFGFLAYTYDQLNGNHTAMDDRVAVLDIEQMRRDVAQLRLRTGVVIVSMHAGNEYEPNPNAQQVAFAHAAIDAGAKLVIGHHPHVVQPVEEYGGGVIFYSLGNLVFDQFQRQETQHGVLAEVTFTGSRLERHTLLPVQILHTGPALVR